MRHALEFFRKSTPALREPVAEDGAEIWELVRACKPLDENSMYCNLIQCDHFRETCVVAERDGAIVGWVSAYVLPYDPETLFVWQVAVAEAARGTGLGGMMLGDLLGRGACRGVRRVQTTITADNDASWALFRRFAETRGGDFAFQAHYTQALHFRERHQTEYMVTVDLGERMRRAA